MDGGTKPWYHKLRKALEDCEQHGTDPDRFAALIAVVLLEVNSPLEFLRNAAGLVHDDQLPLIRGWASGAVMPTPKMRRKVVKAVRDYFAQALLGP